MSRLGGEPAALKLRKGNGVDRDQGGRPVNLGPRFTRGAPEPPTTLTGLAREEWNRIVPGLDALDLLKPEDYAALAEHCLTWQHYMEAVDGVRKRGIVVTNPETGHQHQNPALTASIALGKELRNSCREFGLTPSSEQNLGRAMDSDDGDDPFGEASSTA